MTDEADGHVQRRLQEEFGLRYPLVQANAEQVPLDDGCADLVISEYGASLWCDPYRWIPEAARLLVPGGQLVFLRYSPLLALCVPPTGPVSPVLARPQVGLSRLDRRDHVEFVLPHGEMLRLLRSCGFVVEDLIEIQAPETVEREFADIPTAWARQWPSEEIWKARLPG